MVMLSGVQKYTRAYLHCLVMTEAMGSHLLSSQFIVYDEGIILNFHFDGLLYLNFKHSLDYLPLSFS
jgi:hypothetical protein